jgi:acetyl esterase
MTPGESDDHHYRSRSRARCAGVRGRDCEAAVPVRPRPGQGNQVVDETQSGEIYQPDVEIEDTTVPGGPSGKVSVRIMRPPGAAGDLPPIVYIHGAGWVFGNAHSHDRLIRELTVGTGAAVVFPNYSLSPKAHYPVAI